MPPQKSEDYKITAVQYYLSKNKNQLQTCEIFQCHPRSLMRWVDKYNKNKNITRKNRIFNSNKSLFHHAVSTRDVDDKIIQINRIKSAF